MSLRRHLFYLVFNILSTFGGNPLASAVAIAALDVVKEERLIERYVASVPTLQYLIRKKASELPNSQVFGLFSKG
jgi:acetylornithine/succinyldiaminopimelate/putrescine aminotransferase